MIVFGGNDVANSFNDLCVFGDGSLVKNARMNAPTSHMIPMAHVTSHSTMSTYTPTLRQPMEGLPPDTNSIRERGGAAVLEGDKLLSADLSKLLTKPHFADVVFELETQQIRAHRVILACRSEWFYNLFLNEEE